MKKLILATLFTLTPVVAFSQQEITESYFIPKEIISHTKQGNSEINTEVNGEIHDNFNHTITESSFEENDKEIIHLQQQINDMKTYVDEHFSNIYGRLESLSEQLIMVNEGVNSLNGNILMLSKSLNSQRMENDKTIVENTLNELCQADSLKEKDSNNIDNLPIGEFGQFHYGTPHKLIQGNQVVKYQNEYICSEGNWILVKKVLNN